MPRKSLADLNLRLKPWNKPKAIAFQQEAKAFLGELGKKYQVEITIGTLRFNEFSLRFKVTANALSDAEMLKVGMALYNLDKTRSKDYTLLAFIPRSTKYSFVVQRDGYLKKHKISVIRARELFGETINIHSIGET